MGIIPTALSVDDARTTGILTAVRQEKNWIAEETMIRKVRKTINNTGTDNNFGNEHPKRHPLG
jgi:hypothetical protein